MSKVSGVDNLGYGQVFEDGNELLKEVLAEIFEVTISLQALRHKFSKQKILTALKTL